jgi:Inner membrane protein YgaP-like, transmembrane domain
MKCNLGKTERIIRIVASLAFMALGAVSWNGFYVAGAVVFITAIIAWCPLYTTMGFSTCRETEQEEIPANTVSTDKDKRIRERRFK